ncbi:hypothetical protein pb186bvf_001070 [Paramecium bursaria]
MQNYQPLNNQGNYQAGQPYQQGQPFQQVQPLGQPIAQPLGQQQIVIQQGPYQQNQYPPQQGFGQAYNNYPPQQQFQQFDQQYPAGAGQLIIVEQQNQGYRPPKWLIGGLILLAFLSFAIGIALLVVY